MTVLCYSCDLIFLFSASIYTYTVDDRDKDAPSLTPEQSERLCNRNFGIGGDGVIFALKPPGGDYDFTMRIYNSDGSEPEMCGNGIRCFAQFLQDLGEDGM